MRLSDQVKNVTHVALFRDAHSVKHERPAQKVHLRYHGRRWNACGRRVDGICVAHRSTLRRSTLAPWGHDASMLVAVPLILAWLRELDADAK